MPLGYESESETCDPVHVTPAHADEEVPAQNWPKTVIQIYRETSDGQDVFIRGGKAGCSEDCDVPVRTNNTLINYLCRTQ